MKTWLLLTPLSLSLPPPSPQHTHNAPTHPHPTHPHPTHTAQQKLQKVHIVVFLVSSSFRIAALITSLAKKVLFSVPLVCLFVCKQYPSES